MKSIKILTCSVLWSALIFPAAAVKVRVTGADAVRQLTDAGGTVIAEYESFSILEADAAAVAALGDTAEVLESGGRILLNAGTVDTAQPATRSLRARASLGKGRALHLVQFVGPVKPGWHDALVGAGFQVVDYIPENAYLVYGDTAALNKLRALPARRSGLNWEGEYLPSDRLAPETSAAVAKAKAGAAAPALFAIQMVRDGEANAATLLLVEALKQAAVYRQAEVGPYLNVIVKLAPDAVETLAAQPDVISIRPYVIPRKFDERQDMIVAGNLAGNGPSGTGYLNWLYSKGFTQDQFTASGFVVDVCDSGTDNGTTTPNHFGLYVAGNTGLVSRVAYARLEGTANSGSTIQGCDGHGNLNAHIIGGYNNLSGFPHADSAGYRYGLGVCPFVRLGSSVIFDPAEFTSPDYEDMISRAYRDGARISSDSWGADTAGAYDIDCQQYDALVRDAQPSGAAVTNAGNQEMTIVFAAGNAGSSAQTVGSPGTAKNVITVGAAENVHSHSSTNGGNNAAGNDGCDTPDTEANSANDIASFSSRGPCSDGRAKPEIVAPGTHVTGGVGQQTRTMSGNGNDLACFEGTGVCALPGGGTTGNTNNFFPQGQQWYSTSSGTSHSTPAVAGGCALIRQYFINQGWTVPSPAMVKAFLMNAARYMTGVDAGDTLWSNDQGMGMMNLGFAFDGAPRVLRDQRTNDIFTASGQSRTISGVVVSNGLPLRVTLAWTDAPGSTSGNAYKNDLNLVVIAGGQTYRGNVFSGATSAAGGTADARNNAESVFLPAGTTGTVVITVSAANINSDGVPNYGGALDQDFALVIYNFEEQEIPAIADAGAALVSEGCGAGNGAIDPDEVVTLAVALRNVGSADTTNVVATLLAAGGVTAPSGPESYGALLAEGAAVTNTFTFTATGTCGGTLTATLALADGAASLGQVSYTYTLGGTSDAAATNQNAAAIAINDNAAASPYPSTISIAGLVGTVSKVVVTLNGFSHTYPEDVDVILVSPDGEKVSLMGAVGGGTGVSGLTLTFDDDAESEVGSPITSGTYRPTGTAETMPSPAPADPYASALSQFNGGNPNGDWKLYVADQAAEDSGSIASGWKLAVTASEPLCCGSNKPPVIAAVGNKTVTESNTLSFAVTASDPYDGDPITLVVSNLPGDATCPIVGTTGSFSWVSATPTGVYEVVFNASDKDGADEERVTITVEPAPYVDTNCAVIISEYVEGSSNNKAVEIYNPGAAALDLAASNYVLHLSMNGGSPIYNISLTGTIPAGGTYVIANNTAGATLLALADQTSASMSFNGDDAVVLYRGGTNGVVVDHLGQVGVDPGSYWGTEPNTTVNHTLRRMREITRGNTNTTAAFDPATEWAAYAVDTFDDLRTHDSDCAGPALPTPPVLVAIGAKSVALTNTLQFTVTATPTDGDAVTLTASNLPAGAVFYPTNEAASFLWTNASPTGTYSVTFNAADKDGSDEEPVTITVSAGGGGGVPLSIGGYKLVQSNATQNFTFPAGTTVSPGGHVILARKASKEAFEAAWGVTLGADVVFLNSGDVLPQINGGENYTLLDDAGTLVDGSTQTNWHPNNFSVQRTNLLGSASMTQNWIRISRTNATPGTSVSGTGTAGLRISEYSDAINFSNEFVELYYDAAGGAEGPPVLNAIGAKSTMVSNALQFTVSATMTDGDAVTLTASNLPAGASFYPTNEAGSFVWPIPSPTGTYTVTFNAADNDGADEETITITVTPIVYTLDLSGWQLKQYNSALTYTIPNGTVVEQGGYVIISRASDKAAFEAGWGVTLGADVVFLNSAEKGVQINGSEQYDILNAAAMLVDGTTPAALNPSSSSVQRTNLVGDASAAENWWRTSRTNATPGAGVAGNGTAGLRISEYADAVNYSNEFVELYYDASAGGGTPPLLAPVGNQSVYLGSNLAFAVTATPTEEDPVTLTASNLPSGSFFYPTNELSWFVWDAASSTGTYTVTFNAADDDGSDEETITITVNGLPVEEPDITGFAVPAGATASATLTSVLGQSYTLEYTTDLGAQPPVWTPADTEIGDGGVITLSDPTPADTLRIYRIVTP
ncbi:MAG: S8 family serine peptidase [Kiritimatiellae bacterium]|nr:S8 family serine peptidase [Kiritimatiellia bacterium]